MTNTATRPFRILGIQQIALGALDRTRLEKLWVDLFGLPVTGTFRSERENVDEAILTLGGGPTAVEVDLMQPLDPEKRPAVHQTPLNHVGLWVDDRPAARSRVLALLLVRSLRNRGDPGGDPLVLFHRQREDP